MGFPIQDCVGQHLPCSTCPCPCGLEGSWVQCGGRHRTCVRPDAQVEAALKTGSMWDHIYVQHFLHNVCRRVIACRNLS